VNLGAGTKSGCVRRACAAFGGTENAAGGVDGFAG
jgi:hypothetical protein